MQVQPPTSPVLDASADTNWSQRYLQDTSTNMRKSPLAWWYRLTAPPEPPASASFTKRETARRGKLASTLLFFTYILLSGVIILGISLRNPILIVVVLTLMVLMTVALVFNRFGYSNVTGILVAGAVEIGLIIVIRSAPGGLDPSYLALFDILVFVELLVASLLPVNWIFLAAAVNIAFIIYDIPHQPWDHALALAMQAGASAIVARPIILHAIVTFILWLWIRNASQALERADRAESIAMLEHEIAEQEHTVAEEKRQLELSIQQILQTHIRVSQGDYSARVPLNEGEPLWGVSGSLNNLLARLQRLHQLEKEMFPRLQRATQIEYEFHRLQNEINLSLKALRQAESEQKVIRLRRSNTLLDLLAAELHGKRLSVDEETLAQDMLLQDGDDFLATSNTQPNPGQNGSRPNSGSLYAPNGTKPNPGQNGTRPNPGQNGTKPNPGQNGSRPNSGVLYPQNGSKPNSGFLYSDQRTNPLPTDRRSRYN